MNSSSRRIRGVIYDHDGTLVDSLAVVVEATNAVLAARGLPTHPAPVIIAAMIHPTAPRMGLHAGIADPVEQRRLAEEFYHAAMRIPHRVSAYPGIPALVGEIAARGMPQAVVSNNEGRFVRAVMGALGLAPHFSAMLGEEDMPAAKPDPRGLIQATIAMGRDADECVYLGDSPSDAEAAHGAGMMAIGVTWGIHAPDEMRAMGFDALITDPREMSKIIFR